MTIFIEINRNEIDINDWNRKVFDNGAGAVSSFIGTTRDHFKDKKVLKLEYEAYEAMALKEIEKICKDIQNQYKDIIHIAIVHRIGEVPVGEISILIAISSSHRSDSLKAVNYAIDTVKTTVPIWKKEYYDDSEPNWKNNCESCHYHPKI
ncbi:hypothetical protein DLAC_11846 [Tieghemostelium lacteum]|uniref:Molybdopterin synthase catalytic subunit n=1 Tax=Tieghemostelium lacteum TaxID=361077 RepID=A0A151Z4B2_TIELA|nr:hypothetical protein DLAC_11846 [Tieghemostelium lacteum]|eukprot:KYQ88634.1 hypothetical protein DLAC_11846 [Tieghemostelium lacteum]